MLVTEKQPWSGLRDRGPGNKNAQAHPPSGTKAIRAHKAPRRVLHDRHTLFTTILPYL